MYCKGVSRKPPRRPQPPPYPPPPTHDPRPTTLDLIRPTVMLTWLSSDVDGPSATLVQHSPDVGLMSLVYWVAIDP